MTFLPFKIADSPPDWINVLSIVRVQKISANNWTITLPATVLNNVTDAQIVEIKKLLIYENPEIPSIMTF